MNIDNITNINNIVINRNVSKYFPYTINMIKFQSLFCFELIYFCGVNDKTNPCFRYKSDLNRFFFDLVKLIESLASAAIFVSSNSRVGPSPRTKIFFLTFNKHWWTVFYSKITMFLPQPQFKSEKSERESNPIPYLE